MRPYPMILERVALAIPERRAELGLSLNELERVSRVSRGTITRIERGAHVGDALVVQVAAAMLILELHASYVPPVSIEVQDDPTPVVEFRPWSVGSAA